MNPLGLSSEGNGPSTWGTGVKMAIHRTKSSVDKSVVIRKLLKSAGPSPITRRLEDIYIAAFAMPRG